jgi:hypothetical protein
VALQDGMTGVYRNDIAISVARRVIELSHIERFTPIGLQGNY